MPDRILCDELQQARITEVVIAFEVNALPDEGGILLERKRQTSDVAGVDQPYRAPESGIFNSLVMREREVAAHGLPPLAPAEGVFKVDAILLACNEVNADHVEADLGRILGRILGCGFLRQLAKIIPGKPA